MSEMSLASSAWIVLRKDLAIERAARITLRQIIPFVVTLVVLFGFALDRVLVNDPLVSSDEVPVPFVVPGVFWLAVLFSLVLLAQRSINLELEDGAWDQLKLWGLDPAGVFLGKAAALALQLLAVEVLLGGVLIVAFSVEVTGLAVMVAVMLLATIGLSAVASAYSALSAGIRVRETLIPVLLLPVTTPVLLASVQAWQGALTGAAGTAWPWVRVLVVFSVIYVAVGVLAYGALMEE
jgi:heme exporter protein B